MIFSTASDEDVIAAAVRYQAARLDRGESTLPIVFVPLQAIGGGADTAEVRFYGRDPAIVARRFRQPRPGIESRPTPTPHRSDNEK